MKRRTIALLFISILLLSFIGCNADASAGLFYQLVNAKEPVKIRYKQIIGIHNDGSKDTLYFLTDEGVFATDAGAPDVEVVVKNERKGIVEAAALHSLNTKLDILVNGPDGSGLLSRYTLDSLDTPTKIEVEDYALKGLYANAMVRVEDTNGNTHLGTVDDNGVFSSTVDFNAINSGEIVLLLSQTGKAQNDLSESAQVAVFYDSTEKEHLTYYINGTVNFAFTGLASKDGTPAAFFELDGKFFILTNTGVLYGAEKPDPLSADDVEMKKLSEHNREYTSGAFFYGMKKGDELHLITKSTRANEGFTVLSFKNDIFTNTDTKVSAIDIHTGFGKHITNVTIVDSMFLEEDAEGAHVLLVATLSNGMMSLEIKDPAVNATGDDDPNINGSATEGEAYIF